MIGGVSVEGSRRLFAPRKGEHGPLAQAIAEAIGDTGGGWYRPPFRTQDPAVDAGEPGGGESSSAGTDHGWANCTMSAGAMVLAFHTLGAVDKWGGYLRHHQSDMDGGTDLYDLDEAWASYGQELSIRSGAGWSGVEQDRRDGRAIVLQGEGGTPGAGTYTGGHAIAVMPETHSDGRWLIGNPECSGYEWVSPSQLREWAQRWSSSIAYARSAPHLSGGQPKVSVQFDVLESFVGSVMVAGSGHSYFDLTTGALHGIEDGFSKTAYAKIKVGKGTILGDSDERRTGYLIGVSAAMLLAIDVDPHPAEGGSASDADIVEAVEARDAEWITHLTPD